MTDFEPPIPGRPDDLKSRCKRLTDALTTQILVLDGAMGTALQDCDLEAADFGGAELEGCNEVLCQTRPEVIRTIHSAHLEAGADIIETNSFGGTPLVLAEYGLADDAFELNRLAAEIAREACDAASTDDRPRFVCGSMGPTTKAISVTGGVTYDELVEHYRRQALGLMAGGADYLLLETCQDTLNVKAGLEGIETAFEQSGWRLPRAVSVTIEANGTMLGGQDAEALAVSLAHLDLLYLGLNCATGPDLMRDHLRTFSELARWPVACIPNAGLPNEDGVYTLTPQGFADALSAFVDEGWINLVGGCCGTTTAHVAAVADTVKQRSPRQPAQHDRCFVSGLEAVELTEQTRPLLVGERTNVLGSRAFKNLIIEEDFDAATEVGRAQADKGAQVLDICLQDPELDEARLMAGFVDRLSASVRLPFMVDSTDPAVFETALRHIQGKAILNSTNLEDGDERLERVARLARNRGAAVIVGTIDEQGMAVTVPRKLEVARRAYDLMIHRVGLRPEDIWWDPLVFPCATGDADYLGAAALTIAGVEALKREFPRTRTLLGVSNVSFGLPLAGRDVVNAVFLHRATKAGLDAAIVNTQRLARFADIPTEERALAERLLDLEPGQVTESERAIAAFTDTFRGRKAKKDDTALDHLDVAERLTRMVVEGRRSNLDTSIDEALADDRWPAPLDIVNGPLMAGMAEVGRLFNDNQLIVAEVLQSAEVMKAAVTLLEPHMDQADAAGRATVMLATVKGDVHDIGKNLVGIVLANNGFNIVDLGIRVTSEQLLAAVNEHRPDVIGLSGLLVKSTQQMVHTAADLNAAGIDAPLLVGGAALTRRFVHQRIAPAYGSFCTYGRDAMHGLELVDRLSDPDRQKGLFQEIDELADADREAATKKKAATPQTSSPQKVVRRNIEVPQPPDLDRHVIRFDLDEVWQYLNPQVLYGKHLGLRGSVRKLAETGDEKYLKLHTIVEGVREKARKGAMSASGVWQFFPAVADGDTLRLLDTSSENQIASWTLPRQASGSHLCLTDYVLPNDHVALFVTTAGVGIREQVSALRDAGEYLQSHVLAALAIETAEAAAEVLHARLRDLWGFPDPTDLGIRDILAARYRGKRYSFGYPACPNLNFQKQLFEALRPADIDVELTESDMMDPEASVSALVFHHPDATYFKV